MTDAQKQLEHISEIKNMMERSSRFLSLSGLSGVFAGIYALIGAAIVYWDMGFSGTNESAITYAQFVRGEMGEENLTNKLVFLIGVGAVVMLLSLVTGFFFTSRKAKKQNLKVWDSASKRMLFSLFIPLAAGGIFSFALIKSHTMGLVAPATLIFYGLALLNCSKYTFNDLKYLGLSEIALGLIASFFIGKGLLFWAVGFGVLHIIYGGVMYFKYERNQSE